MIVEHQGEIIERWLADAVNTADLRADRVESAVLRRHGEPVARELLRVLSGGTSHDIEGDGFAAVRESLAELNIVLGQAGVGPTATATFMLGLNHALLVSLPAMDINLGEMMAEVIEASRIIDRLALFTYELFAHSREDVIVRQQDELAELSVSVIRIWDDVLVLPIVGVLDSARALLLTERLLEGLAQTNSRYAILDITGVPTVDTSTAQHLIKTVRAVQLMGADCVISGIRPAIASTIVNLGIDMGNIATRYSLYDALRHCLDGLRYKVSRQADD